MLKFLALVSFTIYNVTAQAAVELLPQVVPAAPLAVAPGVVTARSQQYFARNYNALTAPLVAPVIARAPVVSPIAQGIQYAQFTQFVPGVPVPAVRPVAARPVEPVQPVVPDDVVEIESAKLRQLPVNIRDKQVETFQIQNRRMTPQKLVQEPRTMVKSGRLAAAPVLAANAPVGVSVPGVRNIFGVPYYF